MSVCGDSSSVVTTEEGYNMEFRSYPDDAWYNVRLLLESEKLRIKYDGYPDDLDEVFLAGNLKSEEKLQDFVGRFRTLSAQLQDHDCSKVLKGITVCASDSFADGQILFYDAVVEDVVRKKHSFWNGEEKCECIFLLCWLHGPNVGNVTYKGVANICLLQDSEPHPKLASFVEKAFQFFSDTHIGGNHANSPGFPILIGGNHGNSPGFPILIGGNHGNSPGFPILIGGNHANSPGFPILIGGNHGNTQDTDLGGDKKLYFILLQNLEKELTPSAVSNFIHKQTSISTHAYIFPNLPWEPYTNGVIMLDCKHDAQRLFRFLQDPNHSIVSSNGRPWVATEEMLMNDHWTLMLKSPNTLLNRKDGGFSSELEVVCHGTEKYKKAKELRDIFLQFIDHQKRLHKRLRVEEISISQRLL